MYVWLFQLESDATCADVEPGSVVKRKVTDSEKGPPILKAPRLTLRKPLPLLAVRFRMPAVVLTPPTVLAVQGVAEPRSEANELDELNQCEASEHAVAEAGEPSGGGEEGGGLGGCGAADEGQLLASPVVSDTVVVTESGVKYSCTSATTPASGDWVAIIEE